jgi:hypothetical protein
MVGKAPSPVGGSDCLLLSELLYLIIDEFDYMVGVSNTGKR